MWCQLLKESYHCYWILSLIWLAIALHLLLTTSVSTRGSFRQRHRPRGLRGEAGKKHKKTPPKKTKTEKRRASWAALLLQNDSDKRAMLMRPTVGASLVERPPVQARTNYSAHKRNVYLRSSTFEDTGLIKMTPH